MGLSTNRTTRAVPDGALPRTIRPRSPFPLVLLLALHPFTAVHAAAVQGETDDPSQPAVYGLNSAKAQGGEAGVKGEGWIGVIGNGAIGVQGEASDPTQPGVYGVHNSPDTAGTVGVAGRAHTGVMGLGSTSSGGIGVQGRGSVGVQGESDSPSQAAVRGVSTAQGSGIGVAGEGFIGIQGNSESVPDGIGVQGVGQRGVAGISETGAGLSGTSQSGTGARGHSVSGIGVQGESEQSVGVSGISHNPTAAGVSAYNPGGLAGHFDGNVEIKGQLKLPGGNAEERIKALEAQVAALNATVARMSQLMDWQVPEVFGRPIPQIHAQKEQQGKRFGMVVGGEGFQPGAKVRIRVTDASDFRAEGQAQADAKGKLDPPGYVEIPAERGGSELFVVATDGREDLHNLTGVLWSNTTPKRK